MNNTIEDFQSLSYLHRTDEGSKNQFVVNNFSSTQSDNFWRILTSFADTNSSSDIFQYQMTELSETSTELVEASNELYQEIESIFWSAREEFFEDGMESEFSNKLCSTILKYGSDAIEVITLLIVYGKVCPEVASESLRWLGRIEQPESYEFRRWLLERSLTLSSGIARDGAILGLASMDDKHSIPYLKEAIKDEPSAELKQDMEQVLEQLEC
ncbi:MAG: HEAT repeat domain-containing protein [Cyanobacteria bacterium J06600_6]